MRPLWERYYNDADAILFVLDSASFEDFSKNDTNANDDDTDHHSHSHSWVEARMTLWKVLKANPFVPCCIFINHYQDATCHHIRQRVMPNLLQDIRPHNKNNNDNDNTTTTNMMDHTIVVDPRLVRVFSGSAGTGQGVKASLEWLIPLAKEEQIVNRPPQSLPLKPIP
eukprot:scaffold6686_cov63-Attheya_sp.AAC.2